VKHWKTALAILAALSASLGLAEDFKTINGKEYKDAEVSRVEPKAAEGKRIEEQKAVERDRAEKQNNAEVNLHRLEQQFQATEQRASQTYERAAKGTVSGQVFVSTKGGENFKLGAVQVALFTRDAIDILLAGLKNYADYKIQELSGPVAEAKAALDQATASGEAASETRPHSPHSPVRMWNILLYKRARN
jgi:hypothetical protein